MRKSFLSLIGIGLLMSMNPSFAIANENKALAKKHTKIERQFPDVAHIKPSDTDTRNNDEIVFFDVREEKEFAVSHLQNAVRIDPDISTEEFSNKYAHLTQDKTVIFYCSVGQRSSRLAARTQATLIENGAKAAYNLEGGIFNWHNEQRELVQRDGTPTEIVHPYNVYWGRMVNDRSKTGYTPVRAP